MLNNLRGGKKNHPEICVLGKSESSYWRLMSRTRGSNFGPPGMAMFKALDVKKALRSNR